MITINPHINFNGNCEEAFEFYKSVFGGEYKELKRFGLGEMIGVDEADKISRVALPIGPNVLIGNDIPAFMGIVDENENRSKISVSCESKVEADRIFDGLSVGASVECPIGHSPWGSYYGMFRDKFGIEWIVAFDSE